MKIMNQDEYDAWLKTIEALVPHEVKADMDQKFANLQKALTDGFEASRDEERRHNAETTRLANTYFVC